MLRDGASVVGDEQAWVCGGGAAGADESEAWKRIDRSLRRIARRRAALDAEEANWLREAERVQIWEPLGMVNMSDYLERVLGYAPRTAQQRMQVARALEQLPEITEALSTGELPFSAVRELVRVATAETEATWRAHVGGITDNSPVGSNRFRCLTPEVSCPANIPRNSARPPACA
ncbi:MAG: DUF222 domain-containing protein [Kofleriaceae bacterium]|nr:DUF222 domain-containing protein [Kofleriaceae bacterium]